MEDRQLFGRVYQQREADRMYGSDRTDHSKPGRLCAVRQTDQGKRRDPDVFHDGNDRADSAVFVPAVLCLCKIKPDRKYPGYKLYPGCAVYASFRIFDADLFPECTERAGGIRADRRSGHLAGDLAYHASGSFPGADHGGDPDWAAVLE